MRLDENSSPPDKEKFDYDLMEYKQFTPVDGEHRVEILLATLRMKGNTGEIQPLSQEYNDVSEDHFTCTTAAIHEIETTFEVPI